MKKIFLTAMAAFMLVALAGCNGDTQKKETSQKKDITNASTETDELTGEQIAANNFKTAVNIRQDKSFDINADKIGVSYRFAGFQSYHDDSDFEQEYVFAYPSATNYASGIQIYYPLYSDDNVPEFANINYVRIKEILPYAEAKKEYDYLIKKLSEYFGAENIVDHSSDKSWMPPHDEEVIGVKFAEAKESSHYDVFPGEYQIDIGFSLYALKQKIGNLNTEKIKNGFIWLGLDVCYDSERKCFDAFKLMYNVPISEYLAFNAIEENEESTTELESEDTEIVTDEEFERIDEVRKMCRKAETFPLKSIADMKNHNKTDWSIWIDQQILQQ